MLSLLLLTTAALSEELDIIVRHGNRESPQIAITVDDCYHIEQVEDILDICREHNVPVTFFVIGKALKYADGPVWQEAVRMGCEIGNHTWQHARMTDLTRHEIRFGLLRTQQKVDALLEYHYPMQVMRPPLGKIKRGPITQTIQENGYAYAVLWDVSQTDPKKALRETENGSILLYHARNRDVTCLKKLIPDLIAAGYELVTVSELLGLAPVATSTDLYVYERE